jgi:glycosyltransferase involved in cell wall biosynthesis
MVHIPQFMSLSDLLRLAKVRERPIVTSLESVSICMPVLNEIDVIPEVLDSWLAICAKLPKGSCVLVEDGGSTDGTIEYLRSVAGRNSNLKLIEKSAPEGFGKAAKNLFQNGENYWIFFTDSDGQYVPSDFWEIWARRKEYSIVRGMKLGRQDPLFRRMTSFMWNKLVRFLFELPMSDVNSAFFLMKQSDLNRIIPMLRHLPTMVVSELMIHSYLLNLEIKNIYINHMPRQVGISRGVPPLKLISISIKQFRGLYSIKATQRLR